MSHFEPKQLSADVQYIIPTNHACRIVTHVRDRACLRYLILQLYTVFIGWSHSSVGKALRRYSIGREFDFLVVL